MAKSYDIRKYQSWSFDDHFCLKPPVVLIAAILYLCRSFLMIAFVLAGSVKGGATDNATALLSGGGSVPMTLGVTAFPAVMVLFALFRRAPAAGAFIRWIWAHGRSLLALSAVMEIAAAVLFLYTASDVTHDFSALRFAMLIADVYIAVYVLVSKRVKDTFSDFPIP
jgi:hypothetical protein